MQEWTLCQPSPAATQQLLSTSAEDASQGSTTVVFHHVKTVRGMPLHRPPAANPAQVVRGFPLPYAIDVAWAQALPRASAVSEGVSALAPRSGGAPAPVVRPITMAMVPHLDWRVPFHKKLLYYMALATTDGVDSVVDKGSYSKTALYMRFPGLDSDAHKFMYAQLCVYQQNKDGYRQCVDMTGNGRGCEGDLYMTLEKDYCYWVNFMSMTGENICFIMHSEEVPDNLADRSSVMSWYNPARSNDLSNEMRSPKFYLEPAKTMCNTITVYALDRRCSEPADFRVFKLYTLRIHVQKTTTSPDGCVYQKQQPQPGRFEVPCKVPWVGFCRTPGRIPSNPCMRSNPQGTVHDSYDEDGAEDLPFGAVEDARAKLLSGDV